MHPRLTSMYGKSYYEIQMGSYTAEILSIKSDQIYTLRLLVMGRGLYLRYYQPCVVVSNELNYLNGYTQLAALPMLSVKTAVGKAEFGFNNILGLMNRSNTACEMFPINDHSLLFRLDVDPTNELEICLK